MQPLGEPIEDARPAKHAEPTDATPRAVYQFFLVLVLSLSKDWPERHERRRRWCSLTEARDLTSWKVEVEKALANLPKDIDELEELVKKRLRSNSQEAGSI